jgi:hypothetical protein
MQEEAPFVPSLSSLAIASLLQFAAAAFLAGFVTGAVWIAAAGIAWLVWRWTQKRSKVLLVFLNALILTIPAPSGFGSIAGALGGNADSAEKPGRSGEGAAIVADRTFPGVILFPEVKDHVTLVPPLPAMKKNLFGVSRTQPLDIPFFGSYWLYKWPSRRLPPTAVTMRGDPDEKTFRSTDHTAMSMEAHQNLGTLIPLSCCRAIEVAIRNADRYPGSVWVDLTLANTALPDKPSLSLGLAAVESHPRLESGTRVPSSETLTFEIPAAAKISRFDEFTVRFILGTMRNEHSAGIAIERFRLIPR